MADIHIGTDRFEVEHADGAVITDDDDVVAVNNPHIDVELDAAATMIAPAPEHEDSHAFVGGGVVVYTNDDAAADTGFWVPDTHSRSHDWAVSRYDYGYWLPSTADVEIR